MSTAARERGSLQAFASSRPAARRTRPSTRRRGHPLGRPLDARAPGGARRRSPRDNRSLVMMTTRFAGDPTAGAWRTMLRGAPLVGIDLGAAHAEESLRLAGVASSINRRWSKVASARRGQPAVPAAAAARTSARVRRRACRDRSRRSFTTRMDRLRRRRQVRRSQAASVLGQRFSVDALRHLVERPGLRLPAAGRWIPGPTRRKANSCSAMR